MFKGPGKIVWDNKSSSYPVFELTGINCTSSLTISILFLQDSHYVLTLNLHISTVDYGVIEDLLWRHNTGLVENYAA